MATKLRRLIIGLCVGTFVLLVAMCVAWNMMVFKPTKEKIAKATTDYENEKKDADQLQKQVNLRRQAKDDGALYTTSLEQMRKQYRSLNFDISSEEARRKSWERYIEEFSHQYGAKVGRQIVYAAERSGCQPIKADSLGIKLTGVPQVPEDLSVPVTGFIRPLDPGDLNLTLVGSYGDIIRFLDELNRPVPDPEAPGELLNILFIIKNNLKLTGYSPNITATFTVTPYLIAVGKSVTLPAAAAPEAAAPAGEGAPAGDGAAPAEGAPAPEGEKKEGSA